MLRLLALLALCLLLAGCGGSVAHDPIAMQSGYEQPPTQPERW